MEVSIVTASAVAIDTASILTTSSIAIVTVSIITARTVRIDTTSIVTAFAVKWIKFREEYFPLPLYLHAQFFLFFVQVTSMIWRGMAILGKKDRIRDGR